MAGWLTAAAFGPDARRGAEPWPPVSAPGAAGRSGSGGGKGARPGQGEGDWGEGVLLLSFGELRFDGGAF